MEIILINPRYVRGVQIYGYHWGLAYIAAVLEKEGHTIKIIDINEKKLNDNDLRANLKEDVGVVGIYNRS